MESKGLIFGLLFDRAMNIRDSGDERQRRRETAETRDSGDERQWRRETAEAFETQEELNRRSDIVSGKI